jgi:hypothetical protein
VSTNIYDTLNDSSFNENSIGSPTAASSPIYKRLGVLGPGFGSGAYEFANNMAQRYNNTSKSGFNLLRSTCLMMKSISEAISTLNPEHLDILVVLVVKRLPGKQQGYVVIRATLGTIKIV